MRNILSLAAISIFLAISSCGGSDLRISGKIVSRHELTEEEILVWNELAECMKSSGVELALEVPRVEEIVIRETISCGDVDANGCSAVGSEISIRSEFWNNGDTTEDYWSLFRHEGKHWILGLATGDSDGTHASIWFSLGSPCPDYVLRRITNV